MALEKHHIQGIEPTLDFQFPFAACEYHSLLLHDLSGFNRPHNAHLRVERSSGQNKWSFSASQLIVDFLVSLCGSMFQV